MNFNTIPDTDVLGNKLNVGDTVAVFSSLGISYENCTIIEKYFDDDETDLRRAIQPEEGMWIFGLGNHEIIKIS